MKKFIFIFFIILVAFLLVLLLTSGNLTKKGTSVLGLTGKSIPQAVQDSQITQQSSSGATNDVLTKIKDNVSRLTPDNIASSSQTIQNIINDLKLIQENKKQPKDVICETLCK